MLVEPDALASNARVRLHGASISNTGPTVEIVDHREMLAPVGVNSCDSPYEVDYTHGGGGNVVIDIVRGGTAGGFQGQLAGAPVTAEAEGWTRRLVAAASESNPGNPKLAEIARAIDAPASQPEGPPC